MLTTSKKSCCRWTHVKTWLDMQSDCVAIIVLHKWFYIMIMLLLLCPADIGKLFLWPELWADKGNAASTHPDSGHLYTGTLCYIFHHLPLTGCLPGYQGQAIVYMNRTNIWCHCPVLSCVMWECGDWTCVCVFCPQLEKVLQQGDIGECAEPYMVFKESDAAKV